MHWQDKAKILRIPLTSGSTSAWNRHEEGEKVVAKEASDVSDSKREEMRTRTVLTLLSAITRNSQNA